MHTKQEPENYLVSSMANLTGISQEEAQKHFNKVLSYSNEYPELVTIIQAFIEAGYKLKPVSKKKIIDRYPGIHKKLKHITVKHTERFKDCFNIGENYLAMTCKHPVAIVDGKVVSKPGKATRITDLFEIKPIQGV